jgi:hypothetical protein
MSFVLRTSTGQESAIVGELRIGRAPECEIQLADGLVSRVHATVWMENGQPLVRDQRSSNGTFVNGRPITPGEPHVLRPGDLLRIGDTTFTVALGTGQAASPPPRPPVAAAGAPPAVTARVPSPIAASRPPGPAAPGRARALSLTIGGCVVLALLVVCGGLGLYGATAGRPALSTALAPLIRQAPTPGPGTTFPATPGPTTPAQPGNISVQVLPTVPTAAPMPPAAYAANSQDVAAALANLNEAQLRFIRDGQGAASSHISNASLIDDLLSIAADAFKLALGAENLVQASAVQAGGSAAAGQVAGLYAGLAQYGYAQALDAQNLRLELAGGTLDLPGAAARVADFGARAWNPTVTDPATAGNPFLPFVGNPAAIPVAAPLSPAGAAALQTGLGPQAGLQSWIAASAQTVTRTVSFPRPIRPLGDPQDPALLASLITAAGQADGDRASQADAAGLQRLGATLPSATGSQGALKGAAMAPNAVAQAGADLMTYVDTAAELMTADPKPAGKALPAFPGGSGAALAKGGPNPSDAEAVIADVFSLGDDNTPTKTSELPVKTAAPLVTLTIVNFKVGQVEKITGSSESKVHATYDVVWQTNLIDAQFNITCQGQFLAANGPSGTLHRQDVVVIPESGHLYIYCFAWTLERSLGAGSLLAIVGDTAAVPQAGAPTATPTSTATSTSTPTATSTATPTASPTATATDAGVFTLNGTFNLIQDDSGCHFSDAPSTSGTLQMNVNFKTGQATATFTGGGAGTRSLSCSDGSGTMHWQQSYTANFTTGTVDKNTGALSLSGTLIGKNVVSWSGCKNGNGDDAPCPAGYAKDYTLTVTLTGTVDKSSHAASGTWLVHPIILPTSGDWGGG